MHGCMDAWMHGCMDAWMHCRMHMQDGMSAALHHVCSRFTGTLVAPLKEWLPQHETTASSHLVAYPCRGREYCALRWQPPKTVRMVDQVIRKKCLVPVGLGPQSAKIAAPKSVRLDGAPQPLLFVRLDLAGADLHASIMELPWHEGIFAVIIPRFHHDHPHAARLLQGLMLEQIDNNELRSFRRRDGYISVRIPRVPGHAVWVNRDVQTGGLKIRMPRPARPVQVSTVTSPSVNVEFHFELQIDLHENRRAQLLPVCLTACMGGARCSESCLDRQTVAREYKQSFDRLRPDRGLLRVALPLTVTPSELQTGTLSNVEQCVHFAAYRALCDSNSCREFIGSARVPFLLQTLENRTSLPVCAYPSQAHDFGPCSTDLDLAWSLAERMWQHLDLRTREPIATAIGVGRRSGIMQMFTSQPSLLLSAALAVLPQHNEPTIRQFSACAVVGASGHLLQESFGAEIDEHDAVFRFNYHPASPSRSVGTRTTVRIMGPTEMSRLLDECKYERLSKPNSTADLAPDIAFVTYLNDPQDFARFMAARASFQDERLLLMGSDVIEKTKLLLTYAVHAAALPAHTSNFLPSTGLSGLVLATNLCSSVTAYGFYSTKSDSSYYADTNDPLHFRRLTPAGHNLSHIGSHLHGDKVAHLFFAKKS